MCKYGRKEAFLIIHEYRKFRPDSARAIGYVENLVLSYGAAEAAGEGAIARGLLHCFAARLRRAAALDAIGFLLQEEPCFADLIID